MKYLILLFILLQLSCSRDNSSTNNNSTKYYFQCSVEGRNIYNEFTYPFNVADVYGFASVSSEINAQVQAVQCDKPNTFCYVLTFKLLAQTTGTYTNSTGVNFFYLQIKEGTDLTYYQNATVTLGGNLSVSITKIERATGSTNGVPNVGSLEGTFTGTVVKGKNYGQTLTIVPISGKFLLPLQ